MEKLALYVLKKLNFFTFFYFFYEKAGEIIIKIMIIVDTFGIIIFI